MCLKIYFWSIQQSLEIISRYQVHDLIPPVPELHGAVIAGGVEVSVLDLISPKKVINYHSEI